MPPAARLGVYFVERGRRNGGVRASGFLREHPGFFLGGPGGLLEILHPLLERHELLLEILRRGLPLARPGLSLGILEPHGRMQRQEQTAASPAMRVGHVVDRPAIPAGGQMQRRSAFVAELRAGGIPMLAEGAIRRRHAARPAPTKATNGRFYTTVAAV